MKNKDKTVKVIKPTNKNLAEFYDVAYSTISLLRNSKNKGDKRRYVAMKEYFNIYHTGLDVVSSVCIDAVEGHINEY
jgi:hypothetical protein